MAGAVHPTKIEKMSRRGGGDDGSDGGDDECPKNEKTTGSLK